MSYFDEDISEVDIVDQDGRLQNPKVKRVRFDEVPSLDFIYGFIKAVHHCAQFSTECNIISLVPISRDFFIWSIPDPAK